MTFEDVGLPVSWNNHWQFQSPYESYVGAAANFISYNSSYVLLERAMGGGNKLLFIPDPDTDAKLEYRKFVSRETTFTNPPEEYYIYSNAVKEEGQGYIPSASLTLQGGESKKLSFRFHKVGADYEEAQNVLYEEGSLDISVNPGMILPKNVAAEVDLHTKKEIDSITASDKTAKITENKEKSDGDHKIYTISFEKLGRNDITITYDGDKKSVLQFWIEEPIKDALQRRTDYLMDELRITDPSDPHYNSFLEIDNITGEKKPGGNGCNNNDYEQMYDGPAFIAEKNVYYPVQEEISAVDDYLIDLVWAKEVVQEGSQAEYLRVAGMILKVSIPLSGSMGTMGEQTTADICAALDKEGYTELASEIRVLAERKADGINNNPYPFGSEFGTDSTAEEGAYFYSKMFGNTESMKKTVDKAIAWKGKAPVWYWQTTGNRQDNDWWLFRRLNIVGSGLQIELGSDIYSKAVIENSMNSFSMDLTNLTGTSHSADLTVTGLDAGKYQLLVDGNVQAYISVSGEGEAVFTYQINDEEKHTIEVRPYEKEGVLKVALVGDETLAGNGTSDWETHGIAARLETMFEGEEYETAAFIENGAALTDLAPSQECEDFAPDMVVLLVGNREIENWNKDSFSEDYRVLLEEYQNMNSSPVVYAVTNPAVHGEGTGDLTAENAAAAAAAIREQAGECQAVIIDLNRWTLENPQYQQKNAYLDNNGAEMAASQIYTALTARAYTFAAPERDAFQGLDPVDYDSQDGAYYEDVRETADEETTPYVTVGQGGYIGFDQIDLKNGAVQASYEVKAEQEISLKKIQLKANDSQKYSNDFESGDLAGWQNYEGSWNVSDGAYHGSGNGKSILESMSFSDFIYEVDICVNEATNWGGPVLRVTVTPEQASVEAGTLQRFTAKVEGENDPDTAVVWSVSGGTDGTRIEDGVLYVSADEPAGTVLTVTAASAAEPDIKATAAVTVLENTTTSENVQLYYEFDEGEGNEVKDYSSNSYNGMIGGTINDSSWTEEGFAFGGTNYLRLEDATLVSLDMTIVYRVKRTSEDVGTVSLFWGKNQSDYAGKGLWINSTSENAVFVSTDDFDKNFNTTGISTEDFYPLDEWVEVAVSVSTETGEYAIYRNGVEVETSGPEAVSVTVPTDSYNTIGMAGYDNEYLTGYTMGKYMILNKYISEGEALAICNGKFDPGNEEQNQPPTAGGDFTRQLKAGESIQLNADDLATDPDGDPLTIAAVTAEPDRSVAEAGLKEGVLTITAVAEGETSIKVSVSDGKGGTVQTEIGIIVSEIVDKSGLEALVEEAEQTEAELDRYADGEAKEKFVTALEQAYEILNSEADADSVRNAEEALKEAMQALREKAEKEELQKAIEKAEAIDLKQYTEDSVKAFTDVLKAAKEMYLDNTLSVEEQAEVDQMEQERFLRRRVQELILPRRLFRPEIHFPGIWP